LPLTSKRYIEAGDRNALNNVNRGAFLHGCNAALVWALTFTSVAAAPVAIQMRNAKPDPQKVEITNIPRGYMSSDSTKPAVTPATPPVTPPQPVPLNVKPAPPKNLDVRTGTKIPETK
jgi:hypothetical protein